MSLLFIVHNNGTGGSINENNTRVNNGIKHQWSQFELTLRNKK